MYTRVHTFKFQNKLAKSSMLETIRQFTDTLFDKGLQMRFFIDINDTTLNVVNVWDSEENSAKIQKSFNDNWKDMGINISITGGKTTATYSDKTNLSLMTKKMYKFLKIKKKV